MSETARTHMVQNSFVHRGRQDVCESSNKVGNWSASVATPAITHFESVHFTRTLYFCEGGTLCVSIFFNAHDVMHGTHVPHTVCRFCARPTKVVNSVVPRPRPSSDRSCAVVSYRHGRQRDLDVRTRHSSSTRRERERFVLINGKKSMSRLTIYNTKHGQLGTSRGRGHSVEKASGRVPSTSRGAAGLHRM